MTPQQLAVKKQAVQAKTIAITTGIQNFIVEEIQDILNKVNHARNMLNNVPASKDDAYQGIAKNLLIAAKTQCEGLSKRANFDACISEIDSLTTFIFAPESETPAPEVKPAS